MGNSRLQLSSGQTAVVKSGKFHIMGSGALGSFLIWTTQCFSLVNGLKGGAFDRARRSKLRSSEGREITRGVESARSPVGVQNCLGSKWRPNFGRVSPFVSLKGYRKRLILHP